MKVCTCVLLWLSIFQYFVWCDEISHEEDILENSIFMPLVYLQNYNNSNNSHTFKLPAIFIPVVILQLNPKQNDSQYNGNVRENTPEINNDTKLIIHNASIVNNTESDNDDIEVNFRQSLNRGTKVSKKAENKASDENTDLTTNTTNEANVTSTDIPKNETEIKDSDKSQTISNNSNLYPASNYDNKLLDSLSLTTLNEEIKLPAVEDKRWKNFIVNENNNTNKMSTPDNLPPPKNQANRGKGPYSVALYNNAMIDQISITTNSYTNVESSTARNDRWVRFSSVAGPTLKPTDFKPLAGLYYDGFLHTPLIKMPGFNPHGDYNYS